MVKQGKKGRNRQGRPVGPAHERHRLKWMKQESIQVLQLGLKNGWTQHKVLQASGLYNSVESRFSKGLSVNEMHVCCILVLVLAMGKEMWPVRPHSSTEVVNQPSAMWQIQWPAARPNETWPSQPWSRLLLHNSLISLSAPLPNWLEGAHPQHSSKPAEWNSWIYPIMQQEKPRGTTAAFGGEVVWGLGAGGRGAIHWALSALQSEVSGP